MKGIKKMKKINKPPKAITLLFCLLLSLMLVGLIIAVTSSEVGSVPNVYQYFAQHEVPTVSDTYDGASIKSPCDGGERTNVPYAPPEVFSWYGPVRAISLPFSLQPVS